MVCKGDDLVASALGCCGEVSHLDGKFPKSTVDTNLFASSQVDSNRSSSAPESLLRQGRDLLNKCTTMSEFAEVYNDDIAIDSLKE
jgi:hypothetical protein